LQLTDGSVGIATYTSPSPDRNVTSVWFMVSLDGGITWEPRGRIAHDPEGDVCFNETGVYESAGGNLIAFMRAERDPEKSLYTSTSADLGRTWSEPKREGIQGYPHQAARLPSGNVLLAYGYRYDQMGVRARVLNAECERIPQADEIVLRGDSDHPDLGYPHVLPLNDGTTLVTYYHNINGGTRFIAASVIKEA
jgi:hypothetical protein